jgi:hypothetical protein
MVGALVERLTRVVDRLHEQGSQLWCEAFTALATAVDVAEALADARILDRLEGDGAGVSWRARR